MKVICILGVLIGLALAVLANLSSKIDDTGAEVLGTIGIFIIALGTTSLILIPIGGM